MSNGSKVDLTEYSPSQAYAKTQALCARIYDQSALYAAAYERAVSSNMLRETGREYNTISGYSKQLTDLIATPGLNEYVDQIKGAGYNYVARVESVRNGCSSYTSACSQLINKDAEGVLQTITQDANCEETVEQMTSAQTAPLKGVLESAIMNFIDRGLGTQGKSGR